MNSKPLILLADTTVLYSGIVYNGLESKVLKSGKYIFITTGYNILETCKTLMLKRNISYKDAAGLLKSFPIIVVRHDIYKENMKKAEELIGFRDKFDVPIVALALSLKSHDGIWTSDKDFEVVENRFRIWKSRELI